MKKIFKRTLATIMVVLMLLTSAPLQGFVELEWPEIDFSGVGEWFSSKASAADETLTSEEAVDIFLANKTVWLMQEELYKEGRGCYFFIDLDFDGVLELVANSYPIFRSEYNANYLSNAHFYRIDTTDDTVYEIQYDYSYNSMDFLSYAPFLYMNKTTGEKYYRCYNISNMDSGLYSVKTELMFNFTNGEVEQTNLFYEKKVVSASDYSTKYTYKIFFDTNMEVSWIKYIDFRSSFYGNFVDLNLKTKSISAVRIGSSDSLAQRSLLLESYKAFDYDGRIELTTDKEWEFYLGYPNYNYINVLNNIHIIYNGDINNFDVSKLKFTVGNKNIAEIKNVKTSTRLKEIDIYADVLSKKIGETTIRVTYEGASVDCKLIVKQPNEFKFSIADPENYYELSRVFFDDSGTITSGAIKIPIKLENDFIKDVNYLIDNPDALKALKYKNIRIMFEIEGSNVLSFSSSQMQKKFEYNLDELYFQETVEDMLCLYSVNSNGFEKNEIENIKIKYKVYFDGPSDAETKNYNPENSETRKVKINDEIAFNLQSYLNKYMSEVIAAPSTYGYYKRVMDYSVAQDMKSLEDEFDYKWAELMSKGLVDNAVSLFTDFNEVNGYEIVLADMLSIMNSQNEAEQTQMFGGAVFDFASSYYDALNTFWGEKYINGLCKVFGGGEQALTIDAITEVIAGKTTGGVAYDVITATMKDSKFLRYLDNAVFVSDVVNKALTAYGVVKDTVGGLQKALTIHSAYAAYEQSIKNNKYVFSKLKTAAKNNGNDALAKAIDNYMNFEDAKIHEKIANIIAETVVNGGGSGIQVGLLALGNAIAKGTVEKVFYVVGAVVAGFDCGRLLSNGLCNTSDYAAAAGTVVAAGYLSESLQDAIYDIQREAGYDSFLFSSYEKTKQLDSALNMYRILEEISYDKTVEAIEAEGSSKIGSLVRKLSSKRQESYEETIASMVTGKKMLDNLKTHDGELEKIYNKVLDLGYSWNPTVNEDVFKTNYKTICVQCPVDVFVRDSKGNVVASVENNVVTKETDGIGIVVIEDEKYICLPTTQKYDVEIIATDEGTMDYSVFEYGVDSSSNVRSVSYESVPLTKNKEFTAKLDTEKFTDKNSYNLSTGSQIITATSDDYVPLTAISLDGNKVNSLYVNNELTLSVATTPENASAQSYKWTSSDESIATVLGGIVRGKKAGTVTITCELKSDSSIKDTFTVKVKNCSHSYSAWETVEESTCDKYGYKKRSCSVCNIIETEKLTELKAHEAESESYSFPATCTKDAATITLCKKCGKECNRVETPNTATGHKLGTVTVDDKATTEKSGSQSQKCSTCGAKVNATKIPRILKATLSQSSFTYDGKTKTPKVTITDVDGNALVKNVDYTLKTDSGRIKPGTYKTVITFIGKYSGTKTLKFTVAIPNPTVTATQSTSAVKLTWKAVSGANIYRVYQKSGGSWKKLADVTSLNYTVKNLKAGTKYSFAVKAGAKLNGETIWSNTYTAINTATKAVAPSKITATQTASTIKLSWNKVAGATGYRIYYKSGNSWKVTVKSTTATSHTFKNLKAGAKFTFAVKPYIKTDSGVVWSAYKTFTTSTVPANPTAKVTAPSKGKLTVTWSVVKGADSYQLWYKTGNGSYKLYKTYSGVKTLNFKNLKSGTKYTFAVRAVIKTDGGNVRSGYKAVSATVK